VGEKASVTLLFVTLGLFEPMSAAWAKKNKMEVTLMAPAAGALYNAPAAITLSAIARAEQKNRQIVKVEFFQGTKLIGTVRGPRARNQYTFKWTGVAAGRYTLVAKATNDKGKTDLSDPVSITVNAPPSVSITAPGNNSVLTAPATFTVTASASDSDGSIAKVAFYKGATLIGTATSAPYSVTLSGAAAGVLNLTATAIDNRGASSTSPAVIVTVNSLPSVSLTSPSSNASFKAPANIPLAVQVADTDGSVANVEYFYGTTLITSLSAPPYSFVWIEVPQGTYALTARVTDNLGGVVTSVAVNVTVNAVEVKLYYIHVDHLNTPRLVADDQQRTVWRWDQQEPFGVNVPDENPSGLSVFELPLRLPGQYYDRETNLAYNFFRDYDPGLGRYIQSDIVGLKGGTNTYSYALQNPIQYVDILGLDVNFCYYSDFPTHIGFGIVGEDAKTQGFYPRRHRSPRGPGIVRPDPNPGDEPRECKTVVATPEQDKCMLACRERRKSNPGTYNGVTRQCTDFVRDCALECNVPVGDHGGPLPKWFYEGIKASDFPE
jgi:RHS repeat-associated protein